VGKGWSRGRFLGNNMVWFIMAAIIYTGSDTVHFKINQFSQFNIKEECVEYINTYDEYIKAGLNRAFPDSKVIDIRCIDSNTMNKMQDYMKSKKAIRRDNG
tara:strand:- start:1983 stop:2285 length:303 start_codon:yes stop_codon:yes gene_type:complete